MLMRYAICLLAIFYLSMIPGYGQFKKGMRMAGSSLVSILYNSGTADYTSYESKTTQYNFSFNPSLGWFISEHTVLGGSLMIHPFGDKTTYEQNGITNQSDKKTNFNIGAGGFVRHYFGNARTLLPFAQAGINGGISNFKTEGFFYYPTGSIFYKQTYTGKSSGGTFINTTFQLGMTKMVGPITGLDFYAGYNFSYNTNDFKRTVLFYVSPSDNNPTSTTSNTTTQFTNHGFLLGVGFQVFLDPKK